MAEQIIPKNDLELLESESKQNLNMILVGMTMLMEENNEKANLLAQQNWFQRMSKTISGKNKMTEQEIARNHDKISLYTTQAMAELYNRNCIEHEMILGLGNKVNALYESQVEIKQMMGAFVQKLNQKIESIDNYHMLLQEIDGGKFNHWNPFVSISMIMSQLDLRTVQDSRKMNILMQKMEKQKILQKNEILLSEMLEGILALSENEAGVLALFFGNIRDEYIAEIAEQTIYAYYMLPEKIRKMKNKYAIIVSILRENAIDENYSISSDEICRMFIKAYVDSIIQVAIEEQQNEEWEKWQIIEKYKEDALNLLVLLENMVDSWEPNYGEMNTHKSRKKYAEFLSNLMDNLGPSSYMGSAIMTSLNNMTYFAQRIKAKYKGFRDYEVSLIKTFSSEEDGEMEESFWIGKKASAEFFVVADEYLIIDSQNVNNNFAIETIGTGDKKYKTVAEYFKNFIKSAFYDNDGERKEIYNLEYMNYVCKDFPAMFHYGNFKTLFSEMEKYVGLFNGFFQDVLFEIVDEGGEIEDINEVYNLCQKFPLEYNEDYERVLTRKIDLKKPYIELEYNESWLNSGNGIGYIDIFKLEDYITTIIRLKFVNLDMRRYQPQGEVLENSYYCMSTGNTYSYADVEWGKWLDGNTLELKITKNNSYSGGIGSLKIKIWVNEKPDVVAFISA